MYISRRIIFNFALTQSARYTLYTKGGCHVFVQVNCFSSLFISIERAADSTAH